MASGSMRDIKAKINATKKTSQITKAMNMVSASKLRKAESTIKNYRPFMKSIEILISHLIHSTLDVEHTMLKEREVKRTGYILITSDRGLAGGYNNSLFRKFKDDVEQKHKSSKEYEVAVLGLKGYTYYRNKDLNLVNDEVVNIRDDVQFLDIKDTIQSMIDLYVLEEIDEIVIYYNHYVNTVTQTVEAAQVLPVKDVAKSDEEVPKLYDLEPSPQAVIDTLMPIYIQNMIYGYILNAKASEHASRMTAMKNATDNAIDLIDTLTLHYNRARQAAITQEISEIVGGVAALE
ncbi:ATP synthase F1 subunit gamma [Haloplasma contractile]|uniref:ATP synthase gamma chain n=1 Tax=Haloplasma contractile SSD-17B TaxID=1033810 RepID=U2FJM3_9MOLU|nr:ATP synthase F1 subunit gamma [Haloplasma contractile]ERJ11459.1 ATP synthase gamma chain protein [Haloplasma contractile SSD-17B]